MTEVKPGLGNAKKLAERLAKRAEAANEAMPFVPPKGVASIEDDQANVVAFYDTVHHRWLWDNGTPFTAEQQSAIEAWERNDPESPYVSEDVPPFSQIKGSAESAPEVQPDS